MIAHFPHPTIPPCPWNMYTHVSAKHIWSNGKTASATLVPQILTSIYIYICHIMFFFMSNSKNVENEFEKIDAFIHSNLFDSITVQGSH